MILFDRRIVTLASLKDALQQAEKSADARSVLSALWKTRGEYLLFLTETPPVADDEPDSQTKNRALALLRDRLTPAQVITNQWEDTAREAMALCNASLRFRPNLVTIRAAAKGASPVDVCTLALIYLFTDARAEEGFISWLLMEKGLQWYRGDEADAPLSVRAYLNQAGKETTFQVNDGPRAASSYPLDANETLYYLARGGRFVARLGGLSVSRRCAAARGADGRVTLYALPSGQRIQTCAETLTGFSVDQGLIGCDPDGGVVLKATLASQEDMRTLLGATGVVKAALTGSQYALLDTSGAVYGNLYGLDDAVRLIDFTLIQNGVIGITQTRGFYASLPALRTDVDRLTAAYYGAVGEQSILLLLDEDGRVYRNDRKGEIRELIGAQAAAVYNGGVCALVEGRLLQRSEDGATSRIDEGVTELAAMGDWAIYRKKGGACYLYQFSVKEKRALPGAE